MRYMAVVVTVVLVACSSDDEEACPIAGTYTMTATPEAQSEGCQDLGQAGQTTLTITQRPPGKTGPDFALQMQGVQGACAVEQLAACKVQSKCDILITDATDPANNVGTLQFSWTFDRGGFKGINSGSFPAATSLPRGCTFTSQATGTRR